MWSRFGLIVCFLAVAYAVTEDGGTSSSRKDTPSFGIVEGLRKVADTFKSDPSENVEGSSAHGQPNENQTPGVRNQNQGFEQQFSGRPDGSSSSFGNENGNGQNLHSSSRPSGSSGGFGNQNYNNENLGSSGRPSGSSSGFGNENLSNQGMSSSGRPIGSSSGLGSQNFNNENLQSSGRPIGSSGAHGNENFGNEGLSSSGRPLGSSSSLGSQNFNNEETQSSGRPIGSSGTHGNDNFNNQGLTSSGRPSGSSGGFGNQNFGNEESSLSGRPGDSSGFGNENINNENLHSSGRPVDSSDTYGNENFNNQGVHSSGRPDGESSFNSNDNDHQSSGLRPSNSGGHSGQSNHQGVSNNKEEGEKDEDQKEICFGQLGCFSLEEPWKSALRPVKAPLSPKEIQTTLFFFSRENVEHQKNITLYPNVNMGQVRFDPSKITVFIVHGFANSGAALWMKDMKNAYLKQVDANVMLVDWGKGAQIFSYLQVTGNTRVVGKQLALFVKYLQQNYGADPGKFHLIGHSLGAHICSYLAKEVPGIARLTALDPAQPAFEGFSKEVRLDKSDAEFVDVIHTDARPFLPFLGFGMIAPHGHVDFYMNGGFDQPGCIAPAKKDLPQIKNVLDLAKYPVELIGKAVACPHGRAYEFLTEAFNETEKCIFWGHKADVSNVLKTVTNTVTQGTLKKFIALSTNCSKEDCTPVGFATKKSPLRGSFVVTTGARTPYCISEPGVPAETPRENKKQSFIQKINPKRVIG